MSNSMFITKISRTIRRLTILGALAAVTAGVAGAVLIASAQATGTPRYVASVSSIKAIDEGRDLGVLSSDVYGGFAVTRTGSSTQLGSFRSELLKDFDSGETKRLANDKRCAPAGEILAFKSGRSFLDARAGDRWLCQTLNVTSTGLSAPFTVDGNLFETTSCISPLENCAEFRDTVHGRYNRYDLFGQQQAELQRGGLFVDLPTVGAERGYTMDHRANGAHYRSTVTVRRVA